MIETLIDWTLWLLAIGVGLIVVGSVIFFLYDTVATFRESGR